MVQVVASGIALGSVYALVALGFSMTWVTTKTLNFAQGELVMVGAFVALVLHVDWGWPVALAIPPAVAVSAAAGVLVQRFAVAPFARGPAAIGWILSTVAVSIALRNVGELVWGREARRFPSPVGDELVDLVGIRLQRQQLLIMASLVVIVVVLTVFLGRTVWGKALSAVAQNPRAAALSGIPPAAIGALAYGISGGLAAVAGILLAPVTFVSVHMGLGLVIKSFSVAV
ncbi:MAG: branched-chain amino acid ABC transporter permease, partial [Chloroflexi bacterium]|nr:branched-chain amino acid ABC transporter permease [Chloroflexota bacterium]